MASRGGGSSGGGGGGASNSNSSSGAASSVGDPETKQKKGNPLLHQCVSDAIHEIKQISRLQGHELSHRARTGQGRVEFRCARSSTFSKSEIQKRARAIAKPKASSGGAAPQRKQRPDTTLQIYDCHGHSMITIWLVRKVTAKIDGGLEVSWSERCAIDGAGTSGRHSGSIRVQLAEGAPQVRRCAHFMQYAPHVMQYAYLMN